MAKYPVVHFFAEARAKTKERHSNLALMTLPRITRKWLTLGCWSSQSRFIGFCLFLVNLVGSLWGFVPFSCALCIRRVSQLLTIFEALKKRLLSRCLNIFGYRCLVCFLCVFRVSNQNPETSRERKILPTFRCIFLSNVQRNVQFSKLQQTGFGSNPLYVFSYRDENSVLCCKSKNCNQPRFIQTYLIILCNNARVRNTHGKAAELSRPDIYAWNNASIAKTMRDVSQHKQMCVQNTHRCFKSRLIK